MTNNGKSHFWIWSAYTKNSRKELVAVFQKALKTAGFIGGPMVEIRTIIRRILRERVCDRREQRDGCAALCIDSSGRPRRRCSGYSSEYLHRDDGSDFAGGSAPGIVDIDERTYKHGSRKVAQLS